MNLALALLRAAKAYPHAPAILEQDRCCYSYQQFARAATGMAGFLLTQGGCKRGDRVAIMASNNIDYPIALYAIWIAGCVAVPINAKLHGKEAGWIFVHAGVSFAFLDTKTVLAVDGYLPGFLTNIISLGTNLFDRSSMHDPVDCAVVEPDDLAWLFYTSGTTGRPKGAMLTHRNLLSMSFAYLTDVNPMVFGDVLYHAAPMSHGSGLYIMATIMQVGVNVIPTSGRFDVSEIAAFTRCHPCVSMFAAPTMIKRMVASDVEFCNESIKTIIWGGAPMYVEDVTQAIDRFGPCFAQIYGQGESPMTISFLPKNMIADNGHPDWKIRLGSAGLISSAVEVKIAGNDIGEILVRGDCVMSGYWKDPEATASTLVDGWLHTGDVGELDDAGLLHLRDRSKDVIISGGSNIYPREVEEVLLTHPGISEVSVIGRPDAEWGEIVVACCVGDVSETELDAYICASIARFKCPKAWIWLDSLPKNNYGKVLKTVLRERDVSGWTVNKIAGVENDG